MRYVAVVLCLLALGCGRDPTGPRDGVPLTPGAYVLESVAGVAVPAAIPHDALGRTALEGRLELAATTYTRRVVRRSPAGVTDTVIDSGRLEAVVASVYRMVGNGEPSSVQNWDATHVMISTSWHHTLWRRN